MPWFTELSDARGGRRVRLFQSRPEKGTVIDGLTVRKTSFIATRGRDFSIPP